MQLMTGVSKYYYLHFQLELLHKKYDLLKEHQVFKGVTYQIPKQIITKGVAMTAKETDVISLFVNDVTEGFSE